MLNEYSVYLVNNKDLHSLALFLSVSGMPNEKKKKQKSIVTGGKDVENEKMG